MGEIKKEIGFVAIFDILGFKNILDTYGIDGAYNVLQNLNGQFSVPYSLLNSNSYNSNISVKTFSDTIVATTPSSNSESFQDIVQFSLGVQYLAFGCGVLVKGCIAHGEYINDLKSSILVGKPLVDAHLLHDKLHASVIALHNTCVEKAFDMDWILDCEHQIVFTETPTKFGRISHFVLDQLSMKGDDTPQDEKYRLDTLIIRQRFLQTSGEHSLYLDNTLKLLESIKEYRTANRKLSDFF